MAILDNPNKQTFADSRPDLSRLFPPGLDTQGGIAVNRSPEAPVFSGQQAAFNGHSQGARRARIGPLNGTNLSGGGQNEEQRVEDRESRDRTIRTIATMKSSGPVLNDLAPLAEEIMDQAGDDGFHYVNPEQQDALLAVQAQLSQEDMKTLSQATGIGHQEDGRTVLLRSDANTASDAKASAALAVVNEHNGDVNAAMQSDAFARVRQMDTELSLDAFKPDTPISSASGPESMATGSVAGTISANGSGPGSTSIAAFENAVKGPSDDVPGRVFEPTPDQQLALGG